MSDMFDRCSSLPLFDFSKVYLAKSLLPLAEMSKIFIKTIKGKTIFINCTISETIQIIKDRIEKKENIPPKMQLLFFDGKQVEDDKTLKDYNIPKMSTLHLFLNKKFK